MTIKINTESPVRPENRALLEACEVALQELVKDQLTAITGEDLLVPNSQFLVARVNGQALGCVALVDHIYYGEAKRLFVMPQARGLGLGRALMLALEQAAADIGLTCLRVETGVVQAQAIGLFRAMGYGECEVFGDYPDNPANIFLEKPLSQLVSF